MQAAAELGWLCGAGEASTVWFAGLRLHLAALRPAQHRLDPQEAQRLFRLCSQTDAADCPSVLPLRALLQLAGTGVEASEAELHKMTGAADARLHWFVRWRDAPADDQPAFRAAAWVLVGRLDAARPPAAQHKVALVLALTATDAPAAERAFADALATGADWSLFDLRPPEPPIAVRRPPAAKSDEGPPASQGRAALRRAIVQRLGAGADLAVLLPALRALALWGEDMPAFLAEPACAALARNPWPERYHEEVCGGAR
jgi:hypothetical protein